MDRWNSFLDSLATRGGSIFLMSGFVAGLVGLIIHLLHTHATGDVTTVILSAFSAFEGALLTVLTSTARVPTNGNGTTTTSTTTSASHTGALNEPTK
jgi:hypothetical protein